MRPSALSALQRAHRMDGQARNRREFFLGEARRLAERFELRAERAGNAGFHWTLDFTAAVVRPSYDFRTSAVGGRGFAGVRTRDMAGAAGVTAFVTEADGFIGGELVKILVAGGHQVFGLTKSLDARDRVRRAGATPVVGDLLTPGKWQDETTADWVFHLPPTRWTEGE